MRKYCFQGFVEEKMARAVGRDLGISTKVSMEICNFVKGKTTIKAKQMLNDVLKHKVAVPYMKAYKKIAHKPGMASGKYPEKACKEFISLIESVENNAQSKGLNISELIIVHLNANYSSRPWHYGRLRRRRMKRTTLEIIVEEAKPKKSAKEDKKDAPKKEGKTPVVKEVKAEKEEKVDADKVSKEVPKKESGETEEKKEKPKKEVKVPKEDDKDSDTKEIPGEKKK